MRAINPVTKIDARVRVPGSKSYTQRALIAAALAPGTSTITGALISEDTEHLISALGLLGAGFHRNGVDLTVRGTGGVLTTPARPLFMGNNGTGLRLLTSTVCLGRGTFVLDGNNRMRQRPIKPLVEALTRLGVRVYCPEATGCPPVEVHAAGLPGGKTYLESGQSSQYLSSLLLASPYADKDVEIELKGVLPSRPYVEITLDVMARFGVKVSVEDDRVFHVKAPQAYLARDYDVEGDASSATYLMAAAAIAGGKITVENITRRSSQGDLRLLDILQTMGCKVEEIGRGIRITGPLRNHDDLAFDLKDVPDMVPALAVISAFRKGKTALTGIGHLRVKECDRISALTRELRKLGVRVEEQPEAMTIQGPPTRGAQIDCYDDHRIAMSLAVAGLVLKDIVIKDPDCVRKSFPDFWQQLDALGR